LTSSLAIYLAVFGVLLIAASFLDQFAWRLRTPGVLLVLLLGLFIPNNINPSAGTQALLSLHRADLLAQVAVGMVLFQGGLTTNWRELREVVRPGLRLALVGSFLTALLLMAMLLSLKQLLPAWIPGPAAALFIGAMVCSTDASAVLAVLRPLTKQLPQRLINLIECESAFNDPMAVVLAGVAIAVAAGADTDGAIVISDLVRQFVLGAMVGFIGGSLATQILRSANNEDLNSGRSVLCLAAIFTLMGVSTLLACSPLLAAYIAGLVISNGVDIDSDSYELAMAPYAKLAELLLFLCMGLVVDPVMVVRTFPWIVLLFLMMQLVRLIMVCPLLAIRFNRAEQLFVTLSGLRGAVPIALAIEAAAEPAVGKSWGALMPPLALGVVLLGLLLQGWTLVPFARRLGLAQPG
jgi:CPA1 family monovalent cation:H+ antiporter/cell volume regulation protein A